MSLEPVTHARDRISGRPSGLNIGDDIFDVEIGMAAKMGYKFIGLLNGKFLGGSPHS